MFGPSGAKPQISQIYKGEAAADSQKALFKKKQVTVCQEKGCGAVDHVQAHFVAGVEQRNLGIRLV